MKKLWVLVVCVAGLLCGCRGTKPVYNVFSPADVPSVHAMETVLLRACADKGWRCSVVVPGQIAGVLVVRSHRAEIFIKYSQKGYQIEYKDSANLKYKKGKIHPQYNNWIHYLDKAIATELNVAREKNLL